MFTGLFRLMFWGHWRLFLTIGRRSRLSAASRIFFWSPLLGRRAAIARPTLACLRRNSSDLQSATTDWVHWYPGNARIRSMHASDILANIGYNALWSCVTWSWLFTLQDQTQFCLIVDPRVFETPSGACFAKCQGPRAPCSTPSKSSHELGLTWS